MKMIGSRRKQFKEILEVHVEKFRAAYVMPSYKEEYKGHDEVK